MVWLDHIRLDFLAPYNAAALAQYRALYQQLPANLQQPLNVVEEYYHWAMKHQDPRVKDWPLMNPFHNLALVLGYLLTIFVLVCIMKRVSKPAPTKYLAMFHNLFCTLLSVYMCVEIWRQAIMHRYHIFSTSMDRSEEGTGMAAALWVFYASKIPEFMDTVIMALKRNFHQITFLHVYHHSSIFVIWWIIISYAPGGSSYWSAALNSFVHVVMYGYYLWASLAPKQSRDVKPRWNQPGFYRPYITRFQLIQFCLNWVQAVYMLTYNPPADFPMFTVWILFFYMITMLILFGNFYIKAYKAGGKKKSGKVADKATKESKKEL